MIDPIIQSCDFIHEIPDPCHHRCNERVCVCNMWIANCTECRKPIFGGDDYSLTEHKQAAPYIYREFVCEDCLRREAA